MTEARALTPAQTETLDLIRPPVESRPTYRSTLRMDLRNRLESELVDAADRLEDQLWVAKRALQSVHGCERHHEAEQDRPFAYSEPTARGQIFHKSIELSVHLGGRRDPLQLVDEAVSTLQAKEDLLADYLRTASETTRAEIRSEVGALVTSFLETFPPLRTAWRPTTEARRRVPLCSDQIMLHGRLDLTLGMPNDTTAGRVIVELKTGSPAAGHRDDLRYYALLETLVTGVPPLLLVTFYVDAGRAEIEQVDENLLEAATRRTIDGILRLVDLRSGLVDPRRVAGPACRWCPVSDDCDPGQEFLHDER